MSLFHTEYLCRYHAAVDGEDVVMEILDTAGHVSIIYFEVKVRMTYKIRIKYASRNLFGCLDHGLTSTGSADQHG